MGAAASMAGGDGEVSMQQRGKETLRQIKRQAKVAGRVAARNYQVASAVFRKADITGGRRRKRDAEEREERRRWLLGQKKKDDEEDNTAEAQESKGLKVIEDDEDEEEEDRVVEAEGLGLFEEPPEDAGAKTFFRENAASKFKKSLQRAKKHAHDDKMAVATKVGWKSLLPNDAPGKKGSVKSKTGEKQAETSLSLKLGSTKIGSQAKSLQAALKMRQKVQTREKERRRDTFELTKVAVVDVSSQQVDGTDIQGWNRGPSKTVTWSNIYIYIIRAHGDCQREVHEVYTVVLPKIRETMLAAHCQVHVRDLGVWAPSMEEERAPEASRPAISHALAAVSEPNALRLILLGKDYGLPWAQTSAAPTPALAHLIDPAILQPGASELEILAMHTAGDASLSHTAFGSRAKAPRTLLISCLDLDAAQAPVGGSSIQSGHATGRGSTQPGRASARSARSPERGRQSAQSPSLNSSLNSHRSSSPDRNEGALSSVEGTSNRTKKKKDAKHEGPMAALRRKKAEADAKKLLEVERLNKLVFAALVRNPVTGEAQDPRQTFADLDEDGGGTVDKEEFRNGMKVCGVDLTDAETDVVWGAMDVDGDGDLTAEEICTVLEEEFKKIQAKEALSFSRMPRLLFHKLSSKLPSGCSRQRVDLVKDFQDTTAAREARWLAKFSADLLKDLQGILPVMDIAVVSVEEEKHLLSTSANQGHTLLNYHPDVAEWCTHAELLSYKMREVEADENGEWDSPERALARAQLVEYVKGQSAWPLVLLGDRCGGKSCLLADAVHDLRKERPLDHVIYHCFGDCPDSSDITLALFRIAAEMGRRFDEPDHAATWTLGDCFEKFPKLLLKIKVETTLVIILDGLDRATLQGEPYATVDWTPMTFPAHTRLVISCDEGRLLAQLRRSRTHFGGTVELYEIALPPVEFEALQEPGKDGGSSQGTPKSPSDSGSGSRTGSESGSTASEDEDDEGDVGAIKALASSGLFRRSGLEMTSKVKLLGLLDVIVEQAEAWHSLTATKRFILLVILSRQGVLEQDLYELLNASSQEASILPFCRVSWQEFAYLKEELEPLVMSLNFGGSNTLLCVRGRAIHRCLASLFSKPDEVFEAHHLLAMHYQTSLSFLRKGRWHGEARRAVAEVAYHMSKCEMWTELVPVAGGLRWIEARCALGIHQALAMTLDYDFLCNRTSGPQEWIQTDFLKVKDCWVMVERFAHTFCEKPRWVFSVAANLPDTTAPAILAKEAWSQGRESRPQLAWLFKPQVENPCVLDLSDPAVVWHQAAFTKDMRFLLAVGQAMDVFVWRMLDGKLVHRLSGHEDHIMSLQLAWDDTMLVTASRDGSLLLWWLNLDEMDPDDDTQSKPSRTHSKHSRRASSREEEGGEEGEEGDVEGSEDMKGTDGAMVSSPIAAAIQAHLATVWSCAFSPVFRKKANIWTDVTVDLGHGESQVDRLKASARFLDLMGGGVTPKRFPVSLKGTLRKVRLMTENEKREIRLKKGPKAAGAGEKKGRANTLTATSSGITDPGGGGGMKKESDEHVEDGFKEPESIAGCIVYYDPLPGDALELPDCMLLLASLGATAIFVSCEIEEAELGGPESLRGLGEALSEVQVPVLGVDASVQKILRHNEEVTIERVLERGKTIASAASDGSVKVWDISRVANGEMKIRTPLATLKKHTSYVSDVSFSHLGDLLTSSGGDFLVVLWSTKTWTSLAVFNECLAPVTCSVFSPDDTLIISTSHDGWVRLWRSDDQVVVKATQGPHRGHQWACTFSPDQRMAVTCGHEGKVVLWDLEQMLTRNKELMVLDGHEGPVLACAFSPDGSRVVSCSADRTVKVWQVNKKLEEYSLHHASEVMQARAADRSKKVMLKEVVGKVNAGWELAGGAKEIVGISAHTLAVNVVCFTQDGTALVTGSVDCNIVVWDLAKQTARRTIQGHGAPITVLKFTPDGKTLISGCMEGLIALWDITTGRQIMKFTEHQDRICSVACNLSASRMISTSDDHSVKLWCLDDQFAGMSKTPGLTIYSDSEDEEDVEEEEGGVQAEDASSPSRPGTKGSTKKSRPSTRETARTVAEQMEDARENTKEARGVLFKAYDTSQSLVMQDMKFERVTYCAAFAPNGKWVALGSADSLLRIFKFSDERQSHLEELMTVPRAGLASPEKHRSFVRSVEYDHESRRILTSGVDGTMKLWAARSGVLLRTFVGHTQEIKSCQMSPDCKSVFSCSLDDTARMWNLDSGDELFQLKMSDCVFAVAYSIDGRMVATAAHDGQFKIWERDHREHERRPTRGWPRVRELLRKIVKLKPVPIGLSPDGRTCCSIKRVMRLDLIHQPITSEKQQELTVEHTVTSQKHYSFVLENAAEMAVITDDGCHVIVARGVTLQAYNNGELVFETNKAHKACMNDMRLSEDGQLMATASDDRRARVWRITDEGGLSRVKTLDGHVGAVKCVCFSPNSQFLATGSQDQCIKLWDTTSWKALVTMKAHNNVITAVAFDSPGLKMLSGSDDSTIRVWELPYKVTGRTPPVEIVRIRSIKSTVLTTDFTDDGTRVVGVLQARKIYVWHATEGTPLCWWQFMPFDPALYGDALWRTALLSLTDVLNAVVVGDTGGNTFTFALLGITNPNAEDAN